MHLNFQTQQSIAILAFYRFSCITKFNCTLIYRDDKEWLEYRQIMNVFLLKDAKWTEKLIEMTCDNFTSKVKRLADSESAHQIDNLEDELYLWSIYCNLFTFCFHTEQ